MSIQLTKFMDSLKNFIVENWQYISVALVIVLEIILMIVKRFKVNVQLPHATYEQIIKYVKEAEELYGAGHGKEKLNYVINRYLKHNDIQSCFRTEVSYWIQQVVEDVLTTPEKKGEQDGKK